MGIFGNKKQGPEPEIVTLEQPIQAVGFMVKTSMKSVFRDVGRVLERYMGYKDKNGIPKQKEPWEFVSLSSNFNGDQTWDYYTGHVVSSIDNLPKELVPFEIPGGRYAVFPLRPGNKLMFGLAMGKIKKYIYDSWIPNSKYEFAGMDFEYNNEEMARINPYFVDLYIAVKER